MKLDLPTTKKFVKKHRVEIAIVTGIAVGIAGTLIVKKLIPAAPKILDYTILELTDEKIEYLKNDPGAHVIWENIKAGHAAVEYVPPGGQVTPMPELILYRKPKN